jgi:tRNA threonylcarbamoyladenosine biosynthesis protein TsaB
MNILAIDTSISAGSVALFNDRGHQGEIILHGPRRHSERLMDQIDFLLKNTGTDLSQTDGFTVTTGPGSFTGLRVGITTAKTLAMACGKKIIGISSLHLLALGMGRQNGYICPLVDASRGEVYAAMYESTADGPRKVGEDLLLKPENLKICGPTIFTGEANVMTSYIKDLSHPCTQAPKFLCIPRASVAAEYAYRRFQNDEGIDPDDLYPYYIRRSDAEEKKSNRPNNSTTP